MIKKIFPFIFLPLFILCFCYLTSCSNESNIAIDDSLSRTASSSASTLEGILWKISSRYFIDTDNKAETYETAYTATHDFDSDGTDETMSTSFYLYLKDGTVHLFCHYVVNSDTGTDTTTLATYNGKNAEATATYTLKNNVITFDNTFISLFYSLYEDYANVFSTTVDLTSFPASATLHSSDATVTEYENGDSANFDTKKVYPESQLTYYLTENTSATYSDFEKATDSYLSKQCFNITK